jgi:hypothetical protein
VREAVLGGEIMKGIDSGVEVESHLVDTTCSKKSGRVNSTIGGLNTTWTQVSYEAPEQKATYL